MRCALKQLDGERLTKQDRLIVFGLLLTQAKGYMRVDYTIILHFCECLKWSVKKTKIIWGFLITEFQASHDPPPHSLFLE